MTSNKIIAVAFDLDGTLYPNFRLYVRLLPFLFRHGRLLAAFRETREQIRREQEQDLPPISDFYEYQARLTARRLNAPPELISKKIETLIYRGFEPRFLKIKLFPHVKEILADLRAASLKLGILSDFPLKTKLKNLGIANGTASIADGWDAALCSEETGAIKPAARPFLELAAALGCPPSNILYVGNSYPYDVIGASRAGMKTALITRQSVRLASRPVYKKASPGANPPDFVFNDYRHLRDFVLQ